MPWMKFIKSLRVFAPAVSFRIYSTFYKFSFTLSWRSPLSYRNQSIDLRNNFLLYLRSVYEYFWAVYWVFIHFFVALTREILFCFILGSGSVFQVFIAPFVHVFITWIREVLFRYKMFSQIRPKLLQNCFKTL